MNQLTLRRSADGEVGRGSASIPGSHKDMVGSCGRRGRILRCKADCGKRVSRLNGKSPRKLTAKWLFVPGIVLFVDEGILWRHGCGLKSSRDEGVGCSCSCASPSC